MIRRFLGEEAGSLSGSLTLGEFLPFTMREMYTFIYVFSLSHHCFYMQLLGFSSSPSQLTSELGSHSFFCHLIAFCFTVYKTFLIIHLSPLITIRAWHYYFCVENEERNLDGMGKPMKVKKYVGQGWDKNRLLEVKETMESKKFQWRLVPQ
jgi:hypothetical protein